MDNRLREIEQWVAEARDGLGDGGREAYVHKLYLLDAEIRAVIKDSGILPQVVSPQPATSLVRHLLSLALPVASAAAVLAVATVYLRGGIPQMLAEADARRTNSESSILTARPESAQKNTPPAGPSSPSDWQEYLALNGETIVEFASVPASVEKDDHVVLAGGRVPTVGVAPVRPSQAHNVSSKIILASKPGVKQDLTGRGNIEEGRAGATPTKTILASARKPAAVDANESTSVAPSVVMLAGYSKPAPAEEAQADTTPAPKKIKNTKAVKPVVTGDELPMDTEALKASLDDFMNRRPKTIER